MISKVGSEGILCNRPECPSSCVMAFRKGAEEVLLDLSALSMRSKRSAASSKPQDAMLPWRGQQTKRIKTGAPDDLSVQVLDGPFTENHSTYPSAFSRSIVCSDLSC